MTSIWINLMQLLMIAFWGCEFASPFFLKGAGRSLLFEKEEFDSPEEGDFSRLIGRGDYPPLDIRGTRGSLRKGMRWVQYESQPGRRQYKE